MFRSLLALLVLLIPADLAACGWFFPSMVASPTTMDAQRVLMVWKKDTVDVHVSVRASSAQDDFAWVLPVADNPTLTLGDSALLDQLDQFSQPWIEVVMNTPSVSSGGGGACAPGAMMAGSDFGRSSGAAAPIDVQSGTLGDYEYDIVKAETVEEMIGWLTDDGYIVPDGAAERLAPYVAASMSFVWVKLAASSEPEALTDLQPLVLTMPRSVNSTLSFPLALSAGSAAEIMNTQFFILADKRYRVTNYPSTDLQGVADRLWDIRFDSVSYEDVIDLMTEEAGGRLMVTELAADLRQGQRTILPPLIEQLVGDDTYYLTRLTARTRAENLRDATVTYAHEAPNVKNYAFAQDPNDKNDAGIPFIVLFTLLGLIGWRHKREPSTQR